MKERKFHFWIYWVAGAIILSLFCYFRLKPIFFQDVAYTYDQGRDFLKAAEIVLYKDPTFIGPTTGIMGLYHGAWWYYFLAIPFMIFGGLPIGFYYFNFFMHLMLFIVLFLFLRKHFDALVTLLILLIVAVSPYFISMSTFIGSNVPALPPFLFFLIIHFILFEKKSTRVPLLLFCTGLSLGFIAEAELAFGILLFPSYFIVALLYSPLRKIFLHYKNSCAFAAGIIIPFSLRILFEVRHNFAQTRILFSSIIDPPLHNPKSYVLIVHDRLDLFFTYYFKSIFNDGAVAFVFLFLIFSVLLIRRKDWLYSTTFIFFFFLFGTLFVLSTFHNDNFWSNYLDGLQYLVLLIVTISLSTLLKSKGVESFFYALLVCMSIAIGFISIGKLASPPAKGDHKNLATQIEVVDFIQAQNQGAKNYCLKIYTPPVVPYTYDYLFLYKNLSQEEPFPQKDWVDNKCWFIIESDDYDFRRQGWIDKNLRVGVQRSVRKYYGQTQIELWEK